MISGKFLPRTFNLVLILLLAPALASFVVAGARVLASMWTFEAVRWFLLGGAVSSIGCLVFSGPNLAFIDHMLHEMEHAAVAFVFTGRLPRRMEIDPDQGSRVFVQGGGCLTVLAPYYLPLLTVPVLILKAVAALAFSLLDTPFPALLGAVLDFLIGATLVFHYMCTIKEFGTGQTDINRVGFIPSFAGVLFASLTFLMLSVVVVTGRYGALVEWVEMGAAGTVEAYRDVLEYTTRRLVPAAAGAVQAGRARILCPGCTPTPAP